ncbi:hypothetical protein [Paenibacillus durus]|uniref:Uncharacterized protein n=1 Tax=Paenibacillus durus TaxID=44251 RepID=A0A089HTZ6_PAEDU|nr:hypothetical protein [Paenibacillus durus]AIQ14552.1 hypothetical protein PDUR_23680 [Paenibacillus durus]
MDKKRIFSIILVLLSIIIIILVVKVNVLNSESNNQYKTEIQPVVDRFPRLEIVEKVYWKAEVIGDHGFGPSSYWMKGYVHLNNEVMERFRSSYTWKDVSNFKPYFNLDFDQEHEPSWTFSEEFNNYIKSSSFIGKFYLDVNNGLFYFEVEK